MITIKSFEFNYFQENTFLLYDDTREAVPVSYTHLEKKVA